MRPFVPALLLAGAAAVPAHAAEATMCRLAQSFVCGPQRCEHAVAPSVVVVDFTNHDYRRCDGTGCERLPFLQVRSGAFIDLAFASGTATLSADLTQLVESIALGVSTVRSYGTCGGLIPPPRP